MPRRAVIVGAGPVGCLAALALHKAGWMVTVFDARPGIFFNVILIIYLTKNRYAFAGK